MSGIESEDGKEKQSAKTSIAGPQEEEYGEQIPCSRVKYFLDGLTSVRYMAESDLVDTKRNCLTKFVNSSLLPAETFHNILSLLDHSSNCFLCANDKALWYSAVGLEIQAALNSHQKRISPVCSTSNPRSWSFPCLILSVRFLSRASFTDSACTSSGDALR